jgi:hypothetical protein
MRPLTRLELREFWWEVFDACRAAQLAGILTNQEHAIQQEEAYYHIAVLED